MKNLERTDIIHVVAFYRRQLLPWLSRYFKVVLPGSLPILLSTSKVNIGLALVGVIIGEFLAARRGLGYLNGYNTCSRVLQATVASVAQSVERRTRNA